MLKDITLGQYFPGDTVVHRLDPRTKLLMVIVYIVALFLAKWVVSYAVMLAFLVTAVALSRIRPRALFKGLKPLLFIIIFTAIINVFYTKGDVLCSSGSLRSRGRALSTRASWCCASSCS